MKLKDVKKGAFLTLTPAECPRESQVWTRGDYDRESKKYSIINFSDVSRERFLPGSREVYTDFTF